MNENDKSYKSTTKLSQLSLSDKTAEKEKSFSSQFSPSCDTRDTHIQNVKVTIIIVPAHRKREKRTLMEFPKAYLFPSRRVGKISPNHVDEQLQSHSGLSHDVCDAAACVTNEMSKKSLLSQSQLVYYVLVRFPKAFIITSNALIILIFSENFNNSRDFPVMNFSYAEGCPQAGKTSK